MPKHKCSFNINLQQEYLFVKQRKDDNTADVTCEKCRVLGHGGVSDMEKHLKSEKHRLVYQAAASSSSMLSFFKRTDLPTSKDLDIAAADGTWAFHTLQRNYFFLSNDWTSLLIQACLSKNLDVHLQSLKPAA